MNAISVALNHLKFVIPYEILHIGFIENLHKRLTADSIDERIINSVLRPRVILDTNLHSGVPVTISTTKCKWHDLGNDNFLLTVPKEVLDGKSIISVMSIVRGGYAPTTGPRDSHLYKAAVNVFNNISYGDRTGIHSARLELIGDNTILVEEPTCALSDAQLRCIVEYSDNMQELNPRFYPAFNKLCELAVKYYIYITCVIKLDQGYVYGGHELSSINDIISNYESANEDYLEQLQLFKKLSYMNNPNNMRRDIKSCIGNMF